MTFIRTSEGAIINLAQVTMICDEEGELRAWYGEGRTDYHLLADGTPREMKAYCAEVWAKLSGGMRCVDMHEMLTEREVSP